MGFTILLRRHVYIESDPRSYCWVPATNSRQCTCWNFLASLNTVFRLNVCASAKSVFLLFFSTGVTKLRSTRNSSSIPVQMTMTAVMNGLKEQVSGPDSKVHGANMGPIWGRQDPGGPHVGPMNFAIWGPLRPRSSDGIGFIHYSDVTMSAMASHITGVSNVCSTVFVQAQIKENIKAPRHWPLWRVFTGHRSTHKGPATQKMFPFDDVIMYTFRPRQNGYHFADDIFKCIFLDENIWISTDIP